MDDLTQIIDPPPSRTRLLLDGVRALRKPKLDGAPLLPMARLVRPAVELSAEGIAAYGRACGFRREQGVSLTYPHVLAFPLHLMLLTRPSFPYPASGMVHLANRIRQHQRLQEGQALRLEVYAERWVAHPKGQALSIATRAYSAGALVWEGDSLYLRRGVADPVGAPWDEALALPSDSLVRTQKWLLPADLGRRFAKVSGDFNPIHTSVIGARLSVFAAPSPTACGPWAARSPPSNRRVAWSAPRCSANSSCRSCCPARLRCGTYPSAARVAPSKCATVRATSPICAVCCPSMRTFNESLQL